MASSVISNVTSVMAICIRLEHSGIRNYKTAPFIFVNELEFKLIAPQLDIELE